MENQTELLMERFSANKDASDELYGSNLFNEGYEARRKDKDAFCPYSPMSFEYVQWIAGFECADQEPLGNCDA